MRVGARGRDAGAADELVDDVAVDEYLGDACGPPARPPIAILQVDLRTARRCSNDTVAAVTA